MTATVSPRATLRLGRTDLFAQLHRGAGPPQWTVASAGGAAGLALFWVARTALADAAYGAASYAQNLAWHGQWALVPDIPANSATSPLNVLLLAAITFATRSPIVAAGVLLTITTALTALWLRRLAGSAGAALAGVAVLLCSPLLASTVGLETYLAVALAVGLARFALAERWLAAGVLAGLLVATRLDLATVAVVVVVVAALWTRSWPGATGALGLGAAVGLVWPVFSWRRFGSPVPDTLAVQSVTGARDGRTPVDALGYYLDGWWIPTVLVLVVLVGGVAALLVVAWRAVRRRLERRDVAAAALALAGGADHAAVSALGAAPSFWSEAPLVAGLGLAAVLVAWPSVPWRPTALVATAVVLTVGVVLPGGYAVARGVPWDGTAPVRLEQTTPGRLKAMADGLPTGAVVESSGAVGTLAFFCGTRCSVLGPLADPGRAAALVAEYRRRHPGPVWDFIYARYAPPPPLPARGTIAPDAGSR